MLMCILKKNSFQDSAYALVNNQAKTTHIINK